MSLYTELKEAGCLIDNHESGLFVKVDEKSRPLVEKWRETHKSATRLFWSKLDSAWWYEVFFVYDPWWEARERALSEVQR